jgi:hypothetical protein
MIETCARCGAQSAKIETCEYCKRRIDYSCIKSQKRKKPGKIFICKSCWSSIPSRRLFKAVKGS